MDFRKHVDRVLNLATREFGENVVFLPASGAGSFNVRAIFDNEASVIDENTEQVLSVNQPSLGVNLNDFEVEVRVGDKFKVRGLLFKVKDKREDGQGGATLWLNKVKSNEHIPDTTVNQVEGKSGY